jgi:hypothetical protein
VFYFILLCSVAVGLALFQLLVLECPLLAPDNSDIVQVGENTSVGTLAASRNSNSSAIGISLSSIWFGWTFVSSARVMLYSAALSSWPVLAIFFFFDA